MSERLRVAVSGTGSMGRTMLAAVCGEPDIEPVGVIEGLAQPGVIERPDGRGALPLASDPAALAEWRPDVVVDFTTGTWAPRVAFAALDAGAAPVIGTTGLPDGFAQELDRRARARGLGACIAPNFALGAVLLMHLARIAAPYFDEVEIIELHHDRKVDAPSGTALATLRGMLEARSGRPFVRPGTERETLAGTRGGAEGGVSVHSVRLQGLVAHQEVIFGALGQTLTLRHDTTSRDSFVPGVLLAVRQVRGRAGLALGLDALLGLRD